MAFILYSAKGKNKEVKESEEKGKNKEVKEESEEVETLLPGQGNLESAQAVLRGKPKKTKTDEKEITPKKPRITTKTVPEAVALEEIEQVEDTSSTLAETFEKAEAIYKKKRPYSFNTNSQYEIDTDPYYRVFERRNKIIIAGEPDTYVVFDNKTGAYNIGYKMGDGSVSWTRLTGNSKVLVAKMKEKLEHVPDIVDGPKESKVSAIWGGKLSRFFRLKKAVSYSNSAIFNVYVVSGRNIVPDLDWREQTFVKVGDYYRPVEKEWEPEDIFTWYRVIATVDNSSGERLLGIAKHRGASTFDVLVAKLDGSDSHRVAPNEVKLFDYVSGDQINLSDIGTYYHGFPNKESAKYASSAGTIATEFATEEVDKLDRSTFFFVDGEAPHRVVTGTRYEKVKEEDKIYIKAVTGPATGLYSDLFLRTALNAEPILPTKIDRVARIKDRKSGFYHADIMDAKKKESIFTQGHAVQFEIGSMDEDGAFYPTGKDGDVFWAILPTGRDFYVEVEKPAGGSASLAADTKTLELVSTATATPEQLDAVSKLILSAYPIFSKEIYDDEKLRREFASLLLEPHPNPIYAFSPVSQPEKSKALLNLFINFMFNNLESKLSKDSDNNVTSRENVLAKVDSYLSRVTKVDPHGLAQLFFGAPIKQVNVNIDQFYNDVIGSGVDQETATTERGPEQLRQRGKFIDFYIQSPMIGTLEAGRWIVEAVDAVTVEPSGIYVIKSHGTTKKKQSVYLAKRDWDLNFESGADDSRLPFGAVSFSIIDFRTGDVVANVITKEYEKDKFREISKDEFTKAFYSSRPIRETLDRRLSTGLRDIGLTSDKANTVSTQLIDQLSVLLSTPKVIAGILGVPKQDVVTWLHGPEKLDEKILVEVVSYFMSILGEDKHLELSVAKELEGLISKLSKPNKFSAKNFLDEAPTIAAELMVIVLNKLRSTMLMDKIATEARRSLDTYYDNLETAAFVKVATNLYSGPCAVFADKKDKNKIILYQEGRIYKVRDRAENSRLMDNVISNVVSSKNVFYISSLGRTAVKSEVSVVEKSDRATVENEVAKDIMTFISRYTGDTVMPSDFMEFVQTTIATKLNVKISLGILNKLGQMVAMPRSSFTPEKAQQIAKIFSAAAFIPRTLGHIVIYDIGAGKEGQSIKIYRDLASSNGFWTEVPSEWLVDPKTEKKGIVIHSNSRSTYIKNLISITQPAPAFGDIETTIAAMDRDWSQAPEAQKKVYDFFRRVNYSSGMCLANIVTFDKEDEVVTEKEDKKEDEVVTEKEDKKEDEVVTEELELLNIQMVNQKIKEFFVGSEKEPGILASRLRDVIKSGHKALSKDVKLHDPSTLAKGVAYWAMQNLHISASFIGLSSNSTVEFNKSSFVDLINAYLAMSEKFRADNLYVDALFAAIKVSLGRAMQIVMSDPRYELEREAVLAKVPEEYLSGDAVSQSRMVQLVDYLTQAIMSYWLSNLSSMSAPTGRLKVNQKFSGFSDLMRDPDEVVAGLASASPAYLIGLLLWALGDNKVQRAVRSSLGGANTGVTFHDVMEPDKLSPALIQQILFDTVGSFAVSLMSILDKSGSIVSKYYNLAILKDYNRARAHNATLSLRDFVDDTVNEEYRKKKMMEAWPMAFESMKTRATVQNWKSASAKSIISPSFALAAKFGAGAVIDQDMGPDKAINNGVPFLITALQALTKDHRFAFKMTAGILEKEDFSEGLPFAAQEIKRILETGKFKHSYKGKLDGDSLKKYLLNVYFEIRRRRRGAYYVRPEDSMLTDEGQSTLFADVVKELANKEGGLTKYSFSDVDKEFNFASLPNKTNDKFTPMDKFFEAFKKQILESGMNHEGAFSTIMQAFNYSKNYASFPLLIYMLNRNLGSIPNLSEIKYDKDFFETMGKALAATLMEVSKINALTDSAARGMQKSFISGDLSKIEIVSNIIAFVYCLNNPAIGDRLREIGKLDTPGRIVLNKNMMAARYRVPVKVRKILGVSGVSVSPDFIGMLDQGRVNSLADAIRIFSSRHQDIEDIVDYISGEALYMPEEAKKLFDVFASMAGYQLKESYGVVRIGAQEAIKKSMSGSYDASAEPQHNSYVLEAVRQINDNVVYNICGAVGKHKFDVKKPFSTGAIPVERFSNFTDAIKSALKSNGIHTSDDLVSAIYNTQRDTKPSGEQLYETICDMVTSMFPRQAPDSGLMPVSGATNAAWSFYITNRMVDVLLPEALKNEIKTADVEELSVADILALAEKVFDVLSTKLIGQSLDDLTSVNYKLNGQIAESSVPNDIQGSQTDVQKYYRNTMATNADKYIPTLRANVRALTARYQEVANGGSVNEALLSLSKVILDKKHDLDISGVAYRSLVKSIPLSERIETGVLEDKDKQVLVLPTFAVKTQDKINYYIVLQDLTTKKVNKIKDLDSDNVAIELYPGAEKDIAVVASVSGGYLTPTALSAVSNFEKALGQKMPVDKASVLLALFDYQLGSIVTALRDTLSAFEFYRSVIVKRMGFHSGSYAIISPSILEISATVPIIPKEELPDSFESFLSDFVDSSKDEILYLNDKLLSELLRSTVSVKVLKVDRNKKRRKCAIVAIETPGKRVTPKGVPVATTPSRRIIIPNVPYEYISSASSESVLPGVYFTSRERLLYALSHPLKEKEMSLKKFGLGPVDPTTLNSSWLQKHFDNIKQAEEAGALLTGATACAKRLMEHKLSEPIRTREPLVNKLTRVPVITTRDIHTIVLDVLNRKCKGSEQALEDINTHLAPTLPKLYSTIPVKTRTLANAMGKKSVRFNSGSELINVYWVPAVGADVEFEKNISKYYDTAKLAYGIKKTKSVGLGKSLTEATIIAPIEKAINLLSESLAVAEDLNDKSKVSIIKDAIDAARDHLDEDAVSGQTLMLLTKSLIGGSEITIPVSSSNMFCSLPQLMGAYPNWADLKNKLIVTPRLAETLSGGQEMPCSFTYVESYSDGSEIKVRIADMGDSFKVIPHKITLKSPSTNTDLGVATGGSNSHLEDSSARADSDFVRSKEDKAVKVLRPSAFTRIRNVNGLRLVVYNGKSFTKKFEVPIIPNAVRGTKIEFFPQRDNTVVAGDRYEIVSDAEVILNPEFSLRRTREHSKSALKWERGRSAGRKYSIKISDGRNTFVRSISGKERINRIRNMISQSSTIYEILGAEFGNLGDILKEQMNQIAISERARRTAEIRMEQGGDVDLCADLRALGRKFDDKGNRIDNTIFDDLGQLRCVGIGSKIQPLLHPPTEDVEDSPEVNAPIVVNTIAAAKRMKVKHSGFATRGGVSLLNSLIGKRKQGIETPLLQSALQSSYNSILNVGWNEFINTYEMSASKRFAKKNPYINLVDTYKQLLKAKRSGIRLGPAAERQFKVLGNIIGEGKSYLNMPISKAMALIQDDVQWAVLFRFHEMAVIERMITNSPKNGRGQHASRVSKQLFLLGAILAHYIYLAKHEPTPESLEAVKWYEHFLFTEAQGIVFKFIQQFGLLDAGSRLGITGIRGRASNLFTEKEQETVNASGQLRENIKSIIDSIASNDGSVGYIMGLSNFFGLMPLCNRVLLNTLFKGVVPFGTKKGENNPRIKEVAKELNALFRETMLGNNSTLQLDSSTNMALGELSATFLPENFRKLLAEEDHVDESEPVEGADLTEKQLKDLEREGAMSVVFYKKAVPHRFAKLMAKPRKLRITTMKCKTFGDLDVGTVTEEPSSPMNVPEDNKRRQEQASTNRLLLFKYADEKVIDGQIEALRVVLADKDKKVRSLKKEWIKRIVHSADLSQFDESVKTKFANDTFKDFTRFIYKRDNLHKTVDHLPAMLGKLYEIVSNGHKYDAIPADFLKMFFSYRSPIYDVMRKLVKLFNDDSFLAEQTALIEDVISSNSIEYSQSGDRSDEGEDAPSGTLVNPHT
jgi:hypothetical protein